MFETKTIEDTLNNLNVKQNTGLSFLEVEERKSKFGPNQLDKAEKKSKLLIFFSQFNDPMIFILFAAALISIVISIYQVSTDPINNSFDFADPIIILMVVLLNAIIGTVQESKAEKSLEALEKMSSPTCIVRRDSSLKEIKTSELVPGDIVILEEGNTVPADLRLIETYNLKTDEASLTGESLPVEKDASIVFTAEVPVGDKVNYAFMSTPVVYGRGEGVVVETGMRTETGKIAKMLSENENEQTPLQKKLAELSKFLGLVTIVLVFLIFGVQMIDIFIINKISDSNLIAPLIADDFMFAISLAVAAIPEGLPAVVTIVLALGVQKMVNANTIVRKLPSVETLGSVSYICSDKTGTLTQNKMTVVKAYVNGNIFENGGLLDINSLEFLASGLSLCSNASVDNGVYGDPTEIALVEFANSLNLHKLNLEIKMPRNDELPFDSVRKMMSTKHCFNGKQIIFTKGATDQILKHVTKISSNGIIRNITEEDFKQIHAVVHDMGNSALRVLALAYKEDDQLTEDNLIFVGLVGMIDPPRPEAKPAVQILKDAGITTVMITGDHKITALAIAKDLGIAGENDVALSGEELDELSFEELCEKVKTVRVFARVSPENKVSIVKAIKFNGNIAAMTGDGVNDAPSLKSADIGIAMGITGTDVAKGAADMVLTDDNFASIEKAVEEGRGIFANIRKTVLFLLSTNISEVLIMLTVVVLSLFVQQYDLGTPLIAIHILWVNLITDSLPAIALGSDEKEERIMKRKPRNPNESLFAHGGFAMVIGYGLVITVATVFAFFMIPIFEYNAHSLTDIAILFTEGASGGVDILMQSQTAAFCVLSFSELFHMLGMTSIRKSFVHNFKTKNWIIWLAFVLGIGLQMFVINVPGVNSFFKCQPFSNPIYWLYVFLLSLAPLAVHEIVALILKIISVAKKKH